MHNAASFRVSRAASATRMPSAAKSRAIAALSPLPAPTISATLQPGAVIDIA
jgi:hypothetical protein